MTILCADRKFLEKNPSGYFNARRAFKAELERNNVFVECIAGFTYPHALVDVDPERRMIVYVGRPKGWAQTATQAEIKADFYDAIGSGAPCVSDRWTYPVYHLGNAAPKRSGEVAHKIAARRPAHHARPLPWQTVAMARSEMADRRKKNRRPR